MKKRKSVCNKIQSVCHPGSLLTGVSLGFVRIENEQAICIGKETAGDPGQKPSGMTLLYPPLPAFGHPLPQGMRKTRRGFTLIELLVVVLIIGILAAVALPQYQKAVEKSRATEALTVINTLKKGIDLYILEHGYPQPDDEVITFVGSSADVQIGADEYEWYEAKTLNIDLNFLGYANDMENRPYAYSKHFVYYAFCSSDTCTIYATRASRQEMDEQWIVTGGYPEGKYRFFTQTRNGKWDRLDCSGKCPSNLVR